MSLQADLQDGMLVVTLKGNVNFSTTDELEQTLLGHIHGGSARILIDLSGAVHIDSVAMGVLLRMLTNAREKGGDLRLVAVPEMLLRTLQLSSLATVFKIYPNLEEASKF